MARLLERRVSEHSSLADPAHLVAVSTLCATQYAAQLSADSLTRVWNC